MRIDLFYPWGRDLIREKEADIYLMTLSLTKGLTFQISGNLFTNEEKAQPNGEILAQFVLFLALKNSYRGATWVGPAKVELTWVDQAKSEICNGTWLLLGCGFGPEFWNPREIQIGFLAFGR